MPAFSLYLHIPYCQAKCPYCDFNSYATPGWPEADYVGALAAEIRHYARQPPWAGGTIQTVFFGGGTPSLFSPASLASVLDETRRQWPVAADAEITIEANPGTVSLPTLCGFRSAGITRLSLGVQSFADHHLRRLGRIHDAAEAETAVAQARQAGFDNVSIDMIFALPDQTTAEWDADLARAVQLGTDHISAYNLTYEEGTAFHEWRARRLLMPVGEDTELAMFTIARTRLVEAGFVPYEISNYARPGRVCRHNLTYWYGAPYLGVGAGAHSYTGLGGDAPWGRRWHNTKSPTGYLDGFTVKHSM